MMTTHSYRHLNAASVCLSAALLSTAWLPSLARAAEAGQPVQATQTPNIASGANTRAWLALQDSGKQASKTRQTLGGDAMSKVYERYLESFKQPIHDKDSSKPLGSNLFQ